MQAIMIKVLLPVLIKVVEEMMTSDAIKTYGDKLFDIVEDYVADSESQIDDVLVLPAIQKLREHLNIPDLPDNE